MNNHEVDRTASAGVTTSVIVCARLGQSDNGVKTALRNGDNPHIIVHLDIVINAVLPVHGVAGDAAFQQAIDGGIDEQDAALIRDFRIVQLFDTKINSIHSTGASRDILGGLHAVISTLGIRLESKSVRFRNHMKSHVFLTDRRDHHSFGLGIVNSVNQELSATVILRGIGTPRGSHIAANKTVVAAIIALTNDTDLKQVEGMRRRIVHNPILCGVENRGTGFILILCVQKRDVLSCKANAISNGGGNSSSHFLYLLYIDLTGGSPQALRCLL